MYKVYRERPMDSTAFETDGFKVYRRFNFDGLIENTDLKCWACERKGVSFHQPTFIIIAARRHEINYIFNDEELIHVEWLTLGETPMCPHCIHSDGIPEQYLETVKIT